MPDRRHGNTEEVGCPHCGATISADATFCRACGASDESGWNEETDASAHAVGGYDIDPENDEDFDYDDFVRREFPEQGTRWEAWDRKRLIAAAIILAVCLALLLSMF